VVAINGGDIWRLSIIGSKEKVERGEADVRFALDRILGANAPAYEILSIVPWARRELVADAYSRGRVYLAGDAAHVTSPTGGFGMNLGIADAVDLSWKLDAALRGWSGDALLATYETERRPVAQRAVREASGNLLRTLSPKPDAQFLEPTFAGARQRYEIGRRFAATILREWYKLGIDMGYVYADSPIVAHEPFDGLVRDAFEVSRLAELGHHLANNGRDVFGALTHRRHLDAHLSDAEVQVGAEPARVHFAHEIAARCGDDAHVDGTVRVRADGLDALLGERTKKLGLHVERKLSEFVEKHRAAVGREVAQRVAQPADAVGVEPLHGRDAPTATSGKLKSASRIVSAES
jgi:hypothetical protein